MEVQKSKVNLLDTQTVGRSFINYFIPSSVGMFLMAVNFVVDGVMVGHRLGPVALAGVGIVAPIFTMFLAVALWVGIGGATKYSQVMGEKKHERGRLIFTHALVFVFIAAFIVNLVAFLFREPLVYALGANEETYPFASRYMNVLLPFGLVYTLKNALSVFVRNDGNPSIAMEALITEALSNIALNYFFLYVLNMGVAGAAFSTIIAAFLSVFVLLIHFFKPSNNLRLVRFKFKKGIFLQIVFIGFPSFLAEAGITIFTIAHNVTLDRLAGTDGVAAFSVLNYVHSVILLMFLGMGGAIQPLISYYHGVKNDERKQQTMSLAIWTAVVAGGIFFAVGQLAAPAIVSIFGDFPDNITNLSVTGIRLFFIAYLFMGINFVLTTFYQSIANARMAMWITVARQIVVMLALLLILPSLFGVKGVWLVVPLSEFLVLVIVYLVQERHRLHFM